MVTVAGRASSGTAIYTLQRGATSGFVPRFFAAPVTEFPGAGLVFVSTELGPVLLLGGPADAPTTADRAVKVAAALNALVSAAASKPPAFELRERPQPSVGVVGEVSPFLVPTPEDAAAYSRDWEKGRGAGRRLSPAAVARHWAALLQDYFGLFLYRQRPLKMVAVSPARQGADGDLRRGQPPLAGRRRGALEPGAPDARGHGGEPAPDGARRVGRGRAGPRSRSRVAGTAPSRTPTRAPRGFELQLRTEGGRLAGTLTTWRGGVELKAPVRDIGFDRGSVRFTADQQGTAYRFKGTLEGNTVTGTIERAGKPPASFTLRFVE